MTQKQSHLRSGARVPLLILVFQQVGRPIARHTSAVHYLQGDVPTGVVHAAQGGVPGDGGHRVSRHVGTARGEIMGKFLPLIVENAIGHVKRSQEGPDVVIRPVLESTGKESPFVFLFILQK